MICPCLSVCPSVRHTLRYRVCVINSSYSFLWIFLKPCILVGNIMKMCICLVEQKLFLTELRPFQLSHFGNFLHSRVWSLCNQLLLQFSMDLFETLQTYCGHNEDVHVGF